MKKIFIIFLLFLISMPVISAQIRETYYNPITNDYRPLYNFSYDVFKFLPPFPQDFWMREHLFASQQIPASRLTYEYLQPELLPSWDYLCYKAYGKHDPHLTGVYGLGLYPSRFDVFNMKINETVNVSALLYTGVGIEIYQGARIMPKYNESCVSVELKSPESDVFLLEPTYPYYNINWCYIIEYEICLLAYGNHTVEFYETEVPDTIDNTWAEQYKNKYTSSGSILSLEVPKMKVFIYSVKPTTEIDEDKTEEKGLIDNFNYPFIILIFLIIIGGILYVGRRRNKTSEREKKT